MEKSTTSNLDIKRSLIIAIVAACVGLAAISTQSFWIDEGGTVIRALMPTIGEFWTLMKQLGGSDMQNPLYMILAWGWHHMGATSEFALRALNLPWLIVTVLALKRVRFWPLVCLTSPFVLYYTGEFRPYAMHIAAGALAAAAMSRVIDGRERQDFTGLHAICAACLWLVLNGLTASVWAAGVALGAIVMRPEWLRQKGFWIRVLPWLAVTMIPAAYYAYTMMLGYRATFIQNAGIMNVFFGFYEMTGLLGIGPGRDELRFGPAALISYLWILLPAAVCITGAWCWGLMSWMGKTPKACVFGVACAVVFPILVLVTVGMIQEFRVLGRHMSPVIPAVLLPIAAAINNRNSKPLPGMILGWLAVVFMLTSALSLRFMERHERDDYRKATAMCLKALREGKAVWWQADMNAARYYAFREGGMPLLSSIQVLESNPPSGLMFSDIVFINRPELRYRQGDHTDVFEKNFFTLEEKFKGFEVWTSE